MNTMDNKKVNLKSRNWLLKTKNGVVISMNSAAKLVGNSIYSWADLFGFID